MMRKLVLVVLAVIVGACAPDSAQERGGTLVIVGGGLKADNADVFRAFVDARPNDFPGIAIIPAASGEPAISAQSFRSALASQGVDTALVQIVKLAVMDDPATEDIDESEWRSNAVNPREIAKIEQAGAIWFTGGDQSRITQVLLEKDGSNTPMLVAIRQRLAEGSVVGGTSAGAAIMSDPMIAQGDSFAALVPAAGGERLKFATGLGFMNGILVDQHFGERARLGRLAASLTDPDLPHRIGLGIDENTGIVVRSDSRVLEVVGTGYVTLIDARSANRPEDRPNSIRGLRLGLAAQGDTIDLNSGGVLPASSKRPTVGSEYADVLPPQGGGMAFAGQTLPETIGNLLLDNAAATTLERLSFSAQHGLVFRFTQDEQSQGWWGRDPTGTSRYAIDGVRFDIIPTRVEISKDEQ